MFPIKAKAAGQACVARPFPLWWDLHNMSQTVTAQSRLKDRSGKVRPALLLLLIVLAALGYYGFEIGGVYWRQYKLEDTVARELSFAGHTVDETIHQRVLEYIAAKNLPLSARDVRFARTDAPRTLRVSISYVETVNLLFTEKKFPMSVEVQRPF